MSPKTAAALLGLLTLAACGALHRQASPRIYLGLTAKLPSGGLSPGGPTLQVLPFSAAAEFRSDQLATRTGPDRWNLSQYHRWLAEPGEMVAQAAADYLSRTGRYGAVASAPPPFEPAYRLGGSVRALYWDKAIGRAVVEVEAAAASREGVSGFWVYRAEAPVEGSEVGSFTRAAGTALTEVLGRLARDLESMLESGPRGR
jgi:ABC-type uncharacterized transport system auxiliary subunit